MTALKIADLQRDAYTEGREEGISLGREEGISLGREEGISLGLYQKALEMAENLLQDGFSPEIISKYTGLPLETIRGLVRRE